MGLNGGISLLDGCCVAKRFGFRLALLFLLIIYLF